MTSLFPSTPAANELPTPPRALLRGTRVERFEILRVIGDAASNIEYVAIDQNERSEVVLKEYMPQRLGRRQGEMLRPLTSSAAVALTLGLRAFVEEGRMLANIEHPALVRVLGMLEANGTAYMVMPLYDGMRLQHARQSMTVPPDERLLRPLIDGLLSALEAMHKQDVLHGAVSPGNILLVSDERAVLLGPDLARHVIADDLVESLMTAVEPTFEAPEQRTPSPQNPLGPWTDLYSLAETIRFCISGESRAPHIAPGGQRETMAQMVTRLFGDPPTAVYSAALLETLDASLQARVGARPQTTRRFREMLGVLTPIPEDTPPPPAPLPDFPTFDGTADVRIEPGFDLERDRVGVSPAAAAQRARPAHRPPPRRRRSGVWIPLVLAIGVAVVLWAGWWGGSWPIHVARSTPPASEALPDANVTSLAPASSEAQQPVTELQAPAPAPAPAPAAAPAPAPAPIAEPAPAPITTPTPEPSPLPPVPARAVAAARPPTPAPAPATPIPRERTSRQALASPRDACDGRTQFALYRCMQAQCEQRVWTHHPQCELLRATDTVE
jgi:serine/threonine protein kinase